MNEILECRNKLKNNEGRKWQALAITGNSFRPEKVRPHRLTVPLC
jgi:hypothetical protein